MSREQLLLVSSLEKLRRRYGQAGLDRLTRSLERYRDCLSKRKIGLTAAFIDDGASITQFGLKPLKAITSASAKNAIDHIVARLSTSRDAGPDSARNTSPKTARDARREPPRTVTPRPSHDSNVSILILGGGEVIPYFRLSNPAFDSDSFVLSDNPYGCPGGIVSTEKCLLPERPVGRMPDGSGSDVHVLLTQIDTACEGAVWLSTHPLGRKKSSLGYTAAIWKRASREVWRDIGFTGNLKVCPPLSHVDVTAEWFGGKNFLYFNVHGSDTAPYWFGQAGSSFPTALSPVNVNRLSHEKSMIVTEACYGAIEMDRNRDTSISLAFLSSGSACVVGSTCTAYGALAPPVSEADLIALNFFRNVHKGMAFGKALTGARAQLAALAVSRQGYLDEDDKKTLLQFVLFGDPTVSILPISPGSGEDAKDTRPNRGLRKDRASKSFKKE
ncbi:MAG: C25 family cysteine peptidase [Candidatus Eisenbacteria bacterium]|nr:C25 family cysteine peptidase [Candidatus Eisenbacteria bacterium]